MAAEACGFDAGLRGVRYLSGAAAVSDLKEMEARVERHLALPREEKEAGAEALIAELARFTADALLAGS